MAAAYEPCRWLGAPAPSARPDVFCWVLTILASGGSFAVAVGCLWAVGTRVGLSPGLRLAWLGTFALGTVALTYTQHVNNHIMHLALLAGVCALFARAAATGWGAREALTLGALAGLGFNLDFGSGPLLVAALGGYLLWRTRRAAPVLLFALAAAPWVAAGAGINYAIGGVLKPMNMVPEYSQWPGCPFDARNLTGFVRYGPLDQARYLYCMLFGSPGFFTHNLPLLLALTAGARALRRPFAGRAELIALLGWCAATWLLYGFLSNNYSGKNVSVRWFVPFRAPGFWLLAVVLRDRPGARPPFAVLSVFGVVLGALMWRVGPWSMRMVPLLWPLVGAALVAWAVTAWRARARAVPEAAPVPQVPEAPARRAA
jgi:hypothetical protein